ncbi:hypothetical protein L2E82_45021 [Cichorium intybus]|uniref:Uncharacterized protein n=1 Tax=Cichorium intybus TaxID=13427 RepID=A0ACB8ZSQ0_CICIN|nr:hypothetical protein L2E82_45021 [Cichorium intybus]
MLMYMVKDLPLLEEVSITDSRRSGRLFLNGGKLGEVKEWVSSSAFETVKSEMDRIEVPDTVRECYIPVLELPVSGYVMKGITVVVMAMNVNVFQSGDGSRMISEDSSEDKEEAAYSEAVMEILTKHSLIFQPRNP